MSKTSKIVLAVVIVLGLLVAALYFTTPEAPGTGVQWQSNKVTDTERGQRWRIERWRLKVTNYSHQQLRGGTCPRRNTAKAHVWGGSSWFHEIVSFDTRIVWCSNLPGGGMRNPKVFVTPDNARLLWSYQGVVASQHGHTSGTHCGPFPQPECMFFDKHVQYSRGFEGIAQHTTPEIRWVVTGSGGCAIRKPSGQWEGCDRS